jgi:hypothetical protein
VTQAQANSNSNSKYFIYEEGIICVILQYLITFSIMKHNVTIPIFRFYITNVTIMMLQYQNNVTRHICYQKTKKKEQQKTSIRFPALTCKDPPTCTQILYYIRNLGDAGC